MRRRLEIGQPHLFDSAERELEEALPQRAEQRRIACGEEAVLALAGRVVLDTLPRQRLGDLARRLLRGEDERDVAAEHALEDRADERVVRAAEDDGVHVRVLERPRRIPARPSSLLAERVGALDQRTSCGHATG